MDRKTKILLFLVSINAALLVASNAGGAKMIAVGELAASATVFSYALSFLFTDIISELYGKKAANYAVRIGFASLIISVIFFQVAMHAPAAGFWTGQAAYEQTFGLGPRILLGGWLAYMVSQHLDVWIFHRLRKLTNEKHMWLRNNVSTLISQFIDSCIFMTVAFYGVFPLADAIIGQYLIKLVIAAVDTPILYIAVRYLRPHTEKQHKQVSETATA